MFSTGIVENRNNHIKSIVITLLILSFLSSCDGSFQQGSIASSGDLDSILQEAITEIQNTYNYARWFDVDSFAEAGLIQHGKCITFLYYKNENEILFLPQPQINAKQTIGSTEFSLMYDGVGYRFYRLTKNIESTNAYIDRITLSEGELKNISFLGADYIDYANEDCPNLSSVVLSDDIQAVINYIGDLPYLQEPYSIYIGKHERTAEGLFIVSVAVESQEANYWGQYSVSLEEDGTYSVVMYWADGKQLVEDQGDLTIQIQHIIDLKRLVINVATR